MAVVILHAHTQGAQDLLHDLDVGDGGQVFERDRFAGETGRGQQRQRLVLVPLRRDLAGQRAAAGDAEKGVGF